MGRILAIDYGQKRVGLAVSDELQLIAGSLETVHVKDIFEWIAQYLSANTVDIIVVGEPRTLSNEASDAARFINPFVNKLRKTYPEMRIERFDERFTSVIAKQTILQSGIGKKARQDKSIADRVSATILLQSFMEAREIKTNNRN
ncbi:MAG: Holliday junction resolvase RuvX [Bacteroidales bacterium]|nr:Holliday junction resolvase RuvX [Bacteroidales bacterium]